jgi:hypothetical protein
MYLGSNVSAEALSPGRMIHYETYANGIDPVTSDNN